METERDNQQRSTRSQIVSWIATLVPVLLLVLIVGLSSGFNSLYVLIAAVVGVLGSLLVRRSRNPFLLVQRFALLLGDLAINVFQRNIPDPETYQQQIHYRLPLQGTWSVWQGGITKETSRAWGLPSQRYSYTFYKKDEAGKTFKGDGKQLDDYYAMNQPVLAVADGTVTRMINDIRDYPVPGVTDWQSGDSRGGFLMIKHGEKEYSVFAHLVRGSISVKKGDTVRQGQVIGLCGNSGFSTQPHFHLHVQYNASFFLGVGLPIQFYDIEIDGEPKDHGYISQDQDTVGNRED